MPSKIVLPDPCGTLARVGAIAVAFGLLGTMPLSAQTLVPLRNQIPNR